MSAMFVKKQTTVQHAILRSHIGLLYDSLYISFFDKEKEITCKLARYLKRQNDRQVDTHTHWHLGILPNRKPQQGQPVALAN
jgi:hypothetical protein